MTSDLEAALTSLEALALRKGVLTRHDVRPILLEIGSSIGGVSGPDIEAARRRFQALAQGFREAWEAAVRDELAMACTEHVRSVDPRYLDHPDYDLAYALEARRLLEGRLKAAELTGIGLDVVLAAGIRRADSLLEGRVRKNDQQRHGSARDGERI